MNKYRIIGLTSQYTTTPKPFHEIEETYTDWLLSLGARPLIIPFSALIDHAADYCNFCDGFLIPGGSNVPIDRNRGEIALIAAALKRNLPLLGICHGHQILNLALGGTLRPSIPASPIRHHALPNCPPARHPVQLLPNTPLSTLISADTITVNSFHHQAIDQLAPSLRPMTIAPDGILEAVYHSTAKFCWGVQWHPEKMPDANSSRLIGQAFLAACQNSQPPTDKNSQPTANQTSQPAPNHA